MGSRLTGGEIDGTASHRFDQGKRISSARTAGRSEPWNAGGLGQDAAYCLLAPDDPALEPPGSPDI